MDNMFMKPLMCLTTIPSTCRFTNKDNLVVRCGEWDMAVDVEPVAHQDRDIAQIMVHPAFWHGINPKYFFPYWSQYILCIAPGGEIFY